MTTNTIQERAAVLASHVLDSVGVKPEIVARTLAVGQALKNLPTMPNIGPLATLNELKSMISFLPDEGINLDPYYWISSLDEKRVLDFLHMITNAARWVEYGNEINNPTNGNASETGQAEKEREQITAGEIKENAGI